MPLQAGSTLSHYRLVEKIGEGGMGVVWKAEDTILGRHVAIKLLAADAARDETRRRMFLDEARLASSLSDAHIVQVHELGREGDLDFIVMEHVEGKPLSRLLYGRALPPDKVASLGEQVARALARAHRKGLLHRDLKPGNILVTPDGDAKVVDFGLATLFEPHEMMTGSGVMTRPPGPAHGVDEAETLREGNSRLSVTGTPAYASPEQANGERLDARSDIFSLGIVLYEMTTGQRPFTGVTAEELLQRIARGRFAPPHEHVPALPAELDRIIQKTLAHRRHERYQTMEDLAVDLKRLGRDLDRSFAPSSETLQRPSRAEPEMPTIRRRKTLVGPRLRDLRRWLTRVLKGRGADGKSLLILPFEVRGQDEGALDAGRALAEAVAVNLAQARNLTILPVPTTDELGGMESPNRSQIALTLGADMLLGGTLSRRGAQIEASLHLVDAVRNRLVWGTQEGPSHEDLASLARSLSRMVAEHLGASRPSQYDHYLHAGGTGALASSIHYAESLGALRLSQNTLALEATKRLVEAFPVERDALVLRSAALLQAAIGFERSAGKRKDFDECFAVLKRLDPDNPWGDVFSALLLSYDHADRKATSSYSKVLARTDLTPAARGYVLSLRAQSESILGDTAAAFGDLEEALRLDPANDAIFAYLASALLRVGRLQEGLVKARQALALNPFADRANSAVGWALLRLGRMEESLGYFKRACESNRIPAYCAQYGYALQIAGHIQESLAILSNASECDAINGAAHAIALHKAGMFVEAKEAALRTSRLPESSASCYELALYTAVSGNRAEALRLLRRAVELGLSDLWIERDPDLEPLHGDPEFEALVAEIKKRVGAP